MDYNGMNEIKVYDIYMSRKVIMKFIILYNQYRLPKMGPVMETLSPYRVLPCLPKTDFTIWFYLSRKHLGHGRPLGIPTVPGSRSPWLQSPGRCL